LAPGQGRRNAANTRPGRPEIGETRRNFFVDNSPTGLQLPVLKINNIHKQRHVARPLSPGRQPGKKTP